MGKCQREEGEEKYLICALESPNPPESIFDSFSKFLHPVLLILTQSKSKSKSKSQSQSQSKQLRSLAKQFLPFLNTSLALLHKRLVLLSTKNTSSSTTNTTSIPPQTQTNTTLFKIYNLCIDSIDVLSSQLVSKPWSTDFFRLNMVNCYLANNLFDDALNQALQVLHNFRSLTRSDQAYRNDQEFGLLACQSVLAVVKCVSLKPSSDPHPYHTLIIILQDDARPWFQLLNASKHDKFLSTLVSYLEKCLIFLVRERSSFDADLVQSFLALTLSEFTRLSAKDQFYKFARRFSSFLSSLLADCSSPFILNLFVDILESVAQVSKAEVNNRGLEFVDLVSYWAYEYQKANCSWCCAIATGLNKIASDCFWADPPLVLILGLFATGLSFRGYYLKSKGGKDEPFVKSLLCNENGLGSLADLLGSVQVCFPMGSEDNCSTVTDQFKNSTGFRIDFTEKGMKSYFLPCLKAWKYLCQPLAELVNSERKYIVADDGDNSLSTKLCDIQNTFHQFCDVVLLYLNGTYKEEIYTMGENNQLILNVALAAFTLSFKTGVNKQKGVHIIEHVMASEWIQSQGLKYLSASLYNIGVCLYKNKRIEEVSEVLELSCRASWTCVKTLCQMLADRSINSHDDCSEDAIVDLVADISTKSIHTLDVLYQCSRHKVNEVVAISLEDWSIAEKLFRRLPVPTALLKHWVKIEYKQNKNVDVEDALTTHGLLSSSKQVANRAMGKILEQELLVYEELSPFFPKLSREMQLKIINILLQKVYVTGDFTLQKSKYLVMKGRVLRSCGVEYLRTSIQCLSEAIYAINDMYAEKGNRVTEICHQLAMAYCLRGLFKYEEEPDSELGFEEDIDASLRIWSGLYNPDPANDQQIHIPESIMLLLGHVIDLLSIKGCTKFHVDIYKLMIKIFSLKNLPLKKCVATLWKWRRLSHGLCFTPISNAFIETLSEHCGESVKSFDFWMDCLKGSKTLVIGFQQVFSFLFTLPLQDTNGHRISLLSDIKEVKDVALELISNVPIPSDSAFLAGNLYYDLCERLVSNGRLLEALKYAKEAHRLRTVLFREKFTYSLEKPEKKCNDMGELQKPACVLSNFQLSHSVASEISSKVDAAIWDIEASQLSPWSVLQCYLESTLQVGVLHEILGNGVEAEAILRWGKDISYMQNLPIFMVAYSSALGKLYSKKQFWSLAESELRNAKKVLLDYDSVKSCSKCSLRLHVSVNLEHGDLLRKQCDDNKMGSPTDKVSSAESFYRPALDKLNFSALKNSSFLEVINSFMGGFVKEHCTAKIFVSKIALGDSCTTGKGHKSNMETKRNRGKNASKSRKEDININPIHNSRVTRSRSRSVQNSCIPSQENTNQSNYLGGNFDFSSTETSSLGELCFKMRSSLVDCTYEVVCTCKCRNCWQCLSMEVMKSWSVESFINLKLEYVRRRLLLRLLNGIGKCLQNHDQIHERHEIFLQSISVLASGNPFCHMNPSVSPTYLLDMVVREISGDVFATERAATIYNLCWFLLMSNHSKNARFACCCLYNVQISAIRDWLLLAFILSHDVPVLFRKVCRLLSLLYVLSGSSEHFSLTSSGSKIHESGWASFFHQASVGTHLNHQFCSNMSENANSQHLVDAEGLHGQTCIDAISRTLSRLAPESIQGVEEFVADFFSKLPATTVICVTMLGGAYTRLLEEFHPNSPSVHAWLLLSRLNHINQPITVLLPLDSTLEEALGDDGTQSGSLKLSESENCGSKWHCPWGSTVVDYVAPGFRRILEDNYESSSLSEDTKEKRNSWWVRRKRLDDRLGKLLRNLEDSWLGMWRCLLLGEVSNSNLLESVHKKLVHALKSKCKLDVNESLVKVFLGGGGCENVGEKLLLDLCSSKGCFIGTGGTSELFPNEYIKSEKLSRLFSQLLQQAVSELDGEGVSFREPVILVLDYEVQMLPWENIPILRNQEVYRMPSVGSINVTLSRFYRSLKPSDTPSVATPSIDPLDAFYLLNPSGDLTSTQVKFESWFREHNMKEGKAGCEATVEELVEALKSHDLFIYIGHGGGEQYIPRDKIQKLDKCAATLLMGCSSGSLELDGCYIPRGISLSYLLAGSFFAVANLWEVTDKDIDRFGKAMLDAWLKERSIPSGCEQCNLVAEEFQDMNISRKNIAKKVRRKSPEACNGSSCDSNCDHRPNIGSFIGQARDACTLRFLIGASPVCYGVPTGIKKKKTCTSV